MVDEFKFNVYFDENGENLENLISHILINTLTKREQI